MMKKTLILLLLITFVLTGACACSCNSAAPEKDEWEAATATWVANTAHPFEVRVKAGNSYQLEQKNNDQACTFTMADGKAVTLYVQGLDYANNFDAMIQYFKSLVPDQLSVCKTSQTIIVVHDSSTTEIVSKLTEELCLTTIAPNLDTAIAFFKTIMIRSAGEDYTPLDLKEEYMDF